jgi:hypothetical protein
MGARRKHAQMRCRARTRPPLRAHSEEYGRLAANTRNGRCGGCGTIELARALSDAGWCRSRLRLGCGRGFATDGMPAT